MEMNLYNKFSSSHMFIFLLIMACFTPAAIEAKDGNLCNKISIHCGRTPTSAFTDDERLLVVFVQGDFVYLVSSADKGASFSSPVQVNKLPEPIYTNGENRPKISLGINAEIFVSWTRVTAGRFNGEIRFTRSIDSGTSFEPVKTINDDGLQTGHRFDSMQVDTAGNVYLVWIDKRDRVAASKKKLTYRGAAIYSAVSRDNGLSFDANQLMSAHSCECCRIATAPATRGTALFWRHIFGSNTRDHAFAILGTEGTLVAPIRATSDNWQLDACPHHGPAMVSTSNGTDYHVTWFTNGLDRQGIFYGRINDQGEDPFNIQLISSEPSASHPDLLMTSNDQLWLVWKEFDGTQTQVYLIRSSDGGLSWGNQMAIASTQNESDHPFLIKNNNMSYLSWFTEDEGYRLIPLQVET